MKSTLIFPILGLAVGLTLLTLVPEKNIPLITIIIGCILMMFAFRNVNTPKTGNWWNDLSPANKFLIGVIVVTCIMYFLVCPNFYAKAEGVCRGLGTIAKPVEMLKAKSTLTTAAKVWSESGLTTEQKKTAWTSMYNAYYKPGSAIEPDIRNHAASLLFANDPATGQPWPRKIIGPNWEKEYPK